jgi:hypothetical protein
MHLSLLRNTTWVALGVLLASCAAAVTYAPADMVSISPTNQQVVALDKAIDIRLETGYSRSLKS